MPTASSNSVVQLENVRVEYPGLSALDVPSLSIAPGERLFVLGRSGSGKTTLSRLIKGRLRAKSGSVRVLGIDLRQASAAERKTLQRRVAMIDQEFHLVPRTAVIANVLSGALGRVPTLASLLGIYPTEEWQKAEGILAEVGLNGVEERRVETLSGGQRQRVAIARALMQDADVILADEPVSNLDPELAEDSLDLLVEVTQRRAVTLIVNLHQPRLAKRFATRVIGLHEGRLVFDGDPQSLSTDSEELIYRGDSAAETVIDPEAYGHDRPATTLA